MNRFFALLSIAFMAAFAAPAYAELTAASSPSGDPCPMNKTASMSVSFNNMMEKDVTLASRMLETKIKEITELSKQAGLDNLQMQSSNYSVYLNSPNSNPDMQSWQVSGSVSFNIVPADRAEALLVILSKKGYQPNLNVSSNSNGQPCNVLGILK